MRGGLVGSICFLAFLLSSGIKGQNLLNSYDLQQGDNAELKTVDAPNEDLEESRVPSQYTTEDAAVPADENTRTGQSNSVSSESEEKTVGPPDSTESKSEDQDLLRSTTEPESEERYGLLSNTFAGSTSRVISPSDYIIPHLILGGENLILCSRENELHNIWSPVYQCLVCVCVRDGWALHAVCVSCNTCLNPPEPKPPIFIIEPPPPPPPPPPIPLPLPPLLPLPIPLPPQPIPLPPLPLPPLPPQLIPLLPLPPQPIPLPPLPPQPIPLPPYPLPEPLPLPPFPLPEPLPLPPFPLPEPLPLPPFPLPEPLPLPPFPLPEPLPLPPFPLPEPLPLPPFPLPEPLPLPPFPLPEPLPLPPFPLPEPLPLPPFPLPEPLPLPPLPLPEPVPLPLPDSQVSCSPLPTDSLFQNPLNPCQICICTRIYNVLGQADIQIKCQENPQCAPPPDILPIPPFPEPPQPVPMPQCEGFPPNVPFPHPLDSCKICKCIVEVAYYTPEQRIICIPNPECDEPVLFPELNTDSYPITQPEPEPMPWPPVVIPSTPPSPLPGPPPHETCKPYPPNTPFQHPWDECQICMCSETYGRNVVNIEVNCYTKKSCCIEPPIPEPIVPLPLPYPNYSQSTNQATNNIIFIEPRCRYQQPQSLFVADCKVCVCNVIYTYVVAECTPQPNCGSYPFPINGGNADASAQAIANAYSQDYYLNNQPGFDGSTDSPYLGQYPYDVGIPGNVYAPGSLTNQIAQSEATAISQSGSLYPYPNYYPYSPELSQSSATALANAESSSSQPSYLAGGYPFTGNSLSNAQAQAEAIANTQYDNNAPYSQYPYSLADLSSAQANAEAYANTQYSGFNTYPYPLDGGSLSQYGSYPYSSSQAEASASAESGVPSYGPIQNYLGSNNLIGQYGTYDNYPSSVGIGNYYNAEAQAEAIANAQSNSGGISQYNINPLYLEGSQSNSLAQAQAVANSLSGNSYYSGSYGYPYSTNQVNEQANANALATANVYSNLYTNDNSLNQLGTLWGDSSAQAQGGSETAQSLAQASAVSGRPLIRSGKGLCKYNGDKYHHNCQACFCFQDDIGSLYTLCLGNPCA